MKKSQWKSIIKTTKSRALDVELIAQLRWITQEMISRKLDPLETVLRTIDPNYDKELRPEIKHNPSRPKNPKHGIFRVIYAAAEGGRQKYRTELIEAEDGIDAINKFSDIQDNIFKIEKGLIRIAGVECELVPQARIKEIQSQGEKNENFEDWSPIGRAMLFTLVEELENVREHSASMTIDEFVEKYSE